MMEPWDSQDHNDYREYNPQNIRPLYFAKNKLRWLKYQRWGLVPRYIRSFLTWLYYMEKARYLITNGVVIYLERLMDKTYGT